MYGPLIPSLCYADARSAIQWLDDAFGFKAQLVVPGEGDSVLHSQLVCESPPCIIMAFSRRDDEYGKLQRPPNELGSTTQGLYLVVDDVEAHHSRALSAGAEIVMAPTSQDYGGEAYTCRDLEGHVWSFGTYDPRPGAAHPA